MNIVPIHSHVTKVVLPAGERHVYHLYTTNRVVHAMNDIITPYLRAWSTRTSVKSETPASPRWTPPRDRHIVLRSRHKTSVLVKNHARKRSMTRLSLGEFPGDSSVSLQSLHNVLCLKQCSLERSQLLHRNVDGALQMQGVPTANRKHK